MRWAEEIIKPMPMRGRFENKSIQGHPSDSGLSNVDFALGAAPYAKPILPDLQLPVQN